MDKLAPNKNFIWESHLACDFDVWILVALHIQDSLFRLRHWGQLIAVSSL